MDEIRGQVITVSTASGDGSLTVRRWHGGSAYRARLVLALLGEPDSETVLPAQVTAAAARDGWWYQADE